MLKGWPPRARRKRADWQTVTQTETAGKTYYRVAVAQGWRNWGLLGRRTSNYYSIEINVSTWYWYSPVKMWVGCKASWTTGMNDSFHMNTQTCAVEETAKLTEKDKYFTRIKPTTSAVLRACSQRITCLDAVTRSGPYYTLVWHLVTDQLPDHLCPRTSQRVLLLL